MITQLQGAYKITSLWWLQTNQFMAVNKAFHFHTGSIQAIKITHVLYSCICCTRFYDIRWHLQVTTDLRIVSLGDAHELDRIAGVSVRMIYQTQLSISFLYFWDLGSLSHDNSLLAVTKTLKKTFLTHDNHYKPPWQNLASSTTTKSIPVLRHGQFHQQNHQNCQQHILVTVQLDFVYKSDICTV